MAIAFDATTSGSDTDFGGDITVSHTPVGTPRGVLVFITADLVSTDQSAATCTYGGTSMTQVISSGKSSGEPVTVQAYFLGASVPTGTQSAVWTGDSAGGRYHLTVITFTAADDCEVQNSVEVANGDSVADPSTSLALSGNSCYVALGGFSGASDPGSVTPLSGWGTDVSNEFDFGAAVSVCYSYNTIGTSDVTCGWTQTADDAVSVAVAVKEAGGGTSALPLINAYYS